MGKPISRKFAKDLGTGGSSGYLLIAERGLNGGPRGHKNSHIMLSPARDAKKYPLKYHEVEDLKEVLRIYGDEKINNLYNQIKRNLVAIKPNRKNPRNKSRTPNKHRINHRNSF